MSNLEKAALWATIVGVPIAILGLVPAFHKERPPANNTASLDAGSSKDQFWVGMEEEKIYKKIEDFDKAFDAATRLENNTLEQAKIKLAAYQEAKKKAFDLGVELDDATTELGYVPKFKRKLDVTKPRYDEISQQIDAIIQILETRVRELEQNQDVQKNLQKLEELEKKIQSIQAVR